MLEKLTGSFFNRHEISPEGDSGYNILRSSNRHLALIISDGRKMTSEISARYINRVPSETSLCLLADNFRYFSFPFRGAFHLSLTVLVHYRCNRVCSLGGWFPQLPTEPSCPMVLGNGIEVFRVSNTRLSLSLACYSEQFFYPRHSHISRPTTPRPQGEEIRISKSEILNNIKIPISKFKTPA